MCQLIIKLIFATSVCSPLWIQGSTLSDKVFQEPRNMIVDIKDSPVLQCSHSISGYDRILWYKQTQDGQLVFLGYLLGLNDLLEPEVKNKFKLDGNGNNNGKLVIKSLDFNDTATYFCAASTQCHTSVYHLYKNPLSGYICQKLSHLN
ncbi:hypothetical protein cypCar_00040524 [Cyprinus carpio]|nr:hypothetical protein cypCar_00040524 [Cyprinus carpio]